MKIDIEGAVNDVVEEITHQVESRAYRASNELRNSALTVLRGQRSGKVYKKPGTYGNRMTKQTKNLLNDYGHKLQGGQLYRASAPGEPPAVRSGDLRRSWRQQTVSEQIGKITTVKPAITTDVKYAPILDEGSNRMEPRPFEEPIIEHAMPRIRKIFKEPY